MILDSQLRLSPSCKLLTNYHKRQGRRPWVICSSLTVPDDTERQQRIEALEKAGARVVQIPPVSEPLEGADERLPIPAMLSTLYDLGVRSLMVEGGARVIGSFFAETASTGKPVVDTVIVTVAPTFVGAEGFGYTVQLDEVRVFRSLVLHR